MAVTTAALSFERVELPPEWRCEVCDHNRVVYLQNAERLVCAVCAGARLAERILPVQMFSREDAIAWLERHPDGHHGERSVLMGQRFFSPAMRPLRAEDLEDVRSGEVAFLEIWQEPACRR